MSVFQAMRRGGLAINVVTGVTLGALLASPNAYGGGIDGSESRTAISVTLQKGFITVEAQEAALGDILKTIAHQANFELRIKGELNEKATWSIKYVPIDTVVRKLLRHKSWVFTYAVNDDGALVSFAKLYVLRSGGVAVGEQPALVRASAHSFVQIGREEQILVLQQLIQQPDATVVEDLASLATGQEETAIRSMATIALGRLQSPEAKEALIEATNDENNMVRRWAVKGLGQMWGNDAFEQLTQALLDDPAPIVRRQAVVELTMIGGDEAIGFLRLVASDPDNGVRRVAEHNIGFLQGPREFEGF